MKEKEIVITAEKIFIEGSGPQREPLTPEEALEFSAEIAKRHRFSEKVSRRMLLPAKLLPIA